MTLLEQALTVLSAEETVITVDPPLTSTLEILSIPHNF